MIQKAQIWSEAYSQVASSFQTHSQQQALKREDNQLINDFELVRLLWEISSQTEQNFPAYEKLFTLLVLRMNMHMRLILWSKKLLLP